MRGYLPHRLRTLFITLLIVLPLAICACAPKTGAPSGFNRLGPFNYAKFEPLYLLADFPRYSVEDRRTSPRVIYNIDLRMSMTPSDYVRAGLAEFFARMAGADKEDARELRIGIREFRLELNEARNPYELTSKIQMEIELLDGGQVIYRNLVKSEEIAEIDYRFRQGLRLARTQEALDKSFYNVLKNIFYDPALVAALKQSLPVVARPQSTAPPTVAAEKPKGDDHADDVAVIIGNKDYLANNHKVPDVAYALNDAEQMRRFVIDTLGYREGNVILVKNATQASLVSLFGNERTPRGKLYGWLKPERSRIFVYYSGHGAPSLADGQGYLLPVDGDPNTIELNGYALELLYRNLGQLPARQVTVVLDACFSGSSQAGMVVSSASPAMLKVVDTKAVLPSATVITAAAVSEVASWDEDAQLGLFTRQFLEAAGGKADQEGSGNGDGEVTVAELRSYLAEQVPYLARRLYLREQHPQVIGRDEQVIARMQ